MVAQNQGDNPSFGKGNILSRGKEKFVVHWIALSPSSMRVYTPHLPQICP